MKGCSRRDSGMRDFNNFIETMEVTDVAMFGRRYTWCNAIEGEMWSRMDKFLISPEWLGIYKFKLWGLPRTVSNHYPIILMEDDRDWGPRPFRFINAWVLHTQFLSIVKKNLGETMVFEWAGFAIHTKLKALRSRLKDWNLEIFGNLKQTLKEDEDELHSVDFCVETRDLEEEEKARRKVLRGEEWK
ncbi:hypothetical protein ACSBR1_018607 [Camellia fascicularis]